MARKTRGRMINRDISNSNGFSNLCPEAAVLFCMLIPHYTPHGKMHGGVGYIKEVVCPKISYLTTENIPKLMEQIHENTSVKWFHRDGRYWIHSLNFTTEHQTLKPNKMGEDQFPNYSGIIPEFYPPEVEVKVKDKINTSPDETTENHPLKNEPSLAPPEGVAEYVSRVKQFHNHFIEEENNETLSDWRLRYGDTINVDASLFAATTWLIDNPDKRKKNIKKFYANWLRNSFTRATNPVHLR